MQNLYGHLQKEGKTVLRDLRILIVEIPCPITGLVTRSGVFNVKADLSIEPDIYQFALADNREVDVHVKNSLILGGKRAVYFTFAGEVRQKAMEYVA